MKILVGDVALGGVVFRVRPGFLIHFFFHSLFKFICLSSRFVTARQRTFHWQE